MRSGYISAIKTLTNNQFAAANNGAGRHVDSLSDTQQDSSSSTREEQFIELVCCVPN